MQPASYERPELLIDLIPEFFFEPIAFIAPLQAAFSC
jgi:hypothetical protein